MLLLDAGNSRCKWAWVEQGEWLHQGVLDNAVKAEWEALKDFLFRLAAPEKVLVSNVAGTAAVENITELCAHWNCSPKYILAQTQQCGVRNSYAQAEQLGSDRWAALIAAWQRVQGACLVVNCGTATTVDALSSSGEFLGGLILPGLDLMRQSLKSGTAQLNLESGKPGNFPRNTADAITSGALRATTGAILHQYRLLSELGQARCIVSGGAAGSLMPYLELKALLVENLVLHGLQVIGQNCSTMNDKEMVAR